LTWSNSICSQWWKQKKQQNLVSSSTGKIRGTRTYPLLQCVFRQVCDLDFIEVMHLKLKIMSIWDGMWLRYAMWIIAPKVGSNPIWDFLFMNLCMILCFTHMHWFNSRSKYKYDLTPRHFLYFFEQINLICD